ncbi:CocE/NonD family hydrolase [Thalassotalea sp. ND16A]|uniref:CocE/NonD family hydrolase n=1 Tax=Thalassotalea sp. ND16A TaxID=1535422 RepID=UPI001F2E988C|nr:CocE/NonD family hydrolase [Thalassotalea sp. ND16A]
MWGTSYPGYYTSVAGINSHKALKAISPQAPIADWFFDDFHRNGHRKNLPRTPCF